MAGFRTFEEIKVGSAVSVSRPVTETEVGAMALVSGDVDPWHIAADAPERQAPTTAQAVGAEALLSILLSRRDAAWLGVDLDAAANAAGGPRISAPGSRAWVIPTNEELMIGRHTRRLLEGGRGRA